MSVRARANYGPTNSNSVKQEGANLTLGLRGGLHKAVNDCANDGERNRQIVEQLVRRNSSFRSEESKTTLTDTKE